MRIQKIEEIRKSLVEIGDNLSNAYVKVGNQKYFVHKNTLYMGPDHKKIAGHIENGIVVLSRRKRRHTVKKSRSMSPNSSMNTRSNVTKNNLNAISSNSNARMNVTNKNSNVRNNSNATKNLNVRNNVTRNSNKSISFEEPETPQEPIQSPESNEPEKVEPNVEGEPTRV